MVAVEVLRNGYYPRYTLREEPMRFSEVLDVEMRERREPGVTPGCLAEHLEKMKLLLTEMGKTKGKAGLRWKNQESGSYRLLPTPKLLHLL